MWIKKPYDFLKVVTVESADCPQAYSTNNCRWYATCSCTGTLIIIDPII